MIAGAESAGWKALNVLTAGILARVQRQRKAIADAEYNVTFYANVYSAPGHAGAAEGEAARNALRDSAVRLGATAKAGRLYAALAAVHLTRKKATIDAAVNELYRLSNFSSGTRQENEKSAAAVKRLLNF